MRYPTSRDEQAAFWHLRLQEPDVSAEDIRSALEWQADPQNRAALDRVAAFWNAWPAPLPARVPVEIPRHRALPWRAAAAAMLALCLLTTFAIYHRRQPAPIRVQEYATPIGQVETVILADGTKAVLGGATSIHVRYADDGRRVQMSPGEALFIVAKDPQRPFIVEMPNGSVRALGTQFNVHRGPDEATVTVLEGVVRVSPPDWRRGDARELRAGTQVALATDGVLGTVRAVDSGNAISWRDGRLMFSDRTLRSVVADLNRYSRIPVALGNPRLGDLRISGTVKLDQVDSWLEALGAVLDLRLRHDPDGYVLVSRDAN